MERIRGVSGPILGHYRLAAFTGLTTGLAANAPIFSARWATTQNLRAAIERLKVSAVTTTAFTTAQEIQAACYLASSFTASDSGGTAIIPPAGQSSFLQVSESAQASQFTDLRVAGATALSVGTRTLDTVPFLAVMGISSLASPVVADFDVQSDQRMGAILQGGGPTTHGSATNVPTNAQGIVVTNGSVAQGAAGVVRYLIEFEWLEYNWDSAEGDG